MAQPQMLQVKLSRCDAQPWGFRLQGGVDFAAPLLVQKVNAGSLAEQAGLLPGDAVIKINEVDVFSMRHKDAQDTVVRSGNNFVITVQRGGSTWRPHVQPVGQVPQPQSTPYLQTVTKTSLAHKQPEVQHIGSGYNNSARPFSNSSEGGTIKSLVNKQYNSPVGIYSDESIAETLSAQAEVLAGGVLGVNFKKNEKEYQPEKSEVLRFLREEESGQATPAFSSDTFQDPLELKQQRKLLQQQRQEQEEYEQYQQQLQQQKLQQQQQQLQQQQQPYQPPPQLHPQSQSQPQQLQQQQQNKPLSPQPMPVGGGSATRHVKAPINTPKPPSTGGLPAGQNMCFDCDRLITGVFVRIKDKNLHVECFKCATCGISLKNQGYYHLNNKLYCDVHAKLAALQSSQSSPPGTAAVAPVPNKPNPKLSANTISSALNAHGYNNGISNGPGPAMPILVAAPHQVASPTPAAGNLDRNCNLSTATELISNTQTNNNNNNYNLNNNSNKNMEPEGYGTPNAAPMSGDQPFEYVTLTGNVIRSVVPPGKGVNINYKVNQGYARPFGASPLGPPAAGPRSPISYPPQLQQWNAPAAGPPRAYATLPRAAVGQQGAGGKGRTFGATSAPKRGTGTLSSGVAPGARVPLCNSCETAIRGPFITALGRIWCPDHFICVNGNCNRALQDIGFVEEKGDLYCEYCFEKYLAPTCSKCGGKIKGDCLNAIGRQFHPECFTCAHCGKVFGNTPFFLEDGNPYCEVDWNELFTTKCFACGFPVEAGDRWVEALSHNYHSQCFNCTYCKTNLEGQSFYNKGGRPFCKKHAR